MAIVQDLQAVVIYDEENYDAIETYLVSMLGGEVEASQTSINLGRNINPTKLLGNKIQNQILQKLATNTADGITIYSESEFDSLLKEAEKTGTILVEYGYAYCNLETGEFGEPVSNIEKLDLTQATNLTTIGESAFENSPLVEVKLGNRIETIGESAFKNTVLTNLTIPSSVKEILGARNDGAFYEAQIKKLVFEEGSNLTTIGEEAFKGNQISELIIPKSVVTIKSSSFANNQIKGTFVIPANVETIEISAFSGNQISEIIVEDTAEKPSKLTNFSGFDTNQISKLIVPSNVTIVSGFSWNQIKEVSFEDTEEKPSQLVTIQNYTFQNNDINSEVIIPASVKTIGYYAFANNQISSLVFEDTEGKPSQLTTIGEEAFQSNQISKLTLPSSIMTIDRYAFSSNNIIDLTILSNNITIASDSFEGANNLLTMLYINMKNITANGIAFCEKSTIENLTIGADVESITSISAGMGYNGAFDWHGIKKLIFEDSELKPSKLATIDVNSFANNKIEGEVVIPSSVTKIGGAVFVSNENLTKIIIKRTESTEMTLATNWNVKNYSTTPYPTYEVEYNPNYAG